MNNYPAEDPEGRATATAADRRTDETAANYRTEPSDVIRADEIADEDVVILDGDVTDSPESDRYPDRAAAGNGLAGTGQEADGVPAGTAPVGTPADAPAGAPGGAPADGLASGPGAAPGAPAVAQPAGGLAQLQDRWLAIQSDFVDDPRRSVTAAAKLVTEAIGVLTAEINERGTSLRGSWESSDADTEVLRTALREYRSFLDRLVAL